MFSKWRERAVSRLAGQRHSFEKGIGFRKRLDPFLLLILAVFFLGLLALGLIGASLHQRFGWFDPEPMQPLVDERLASNIRSDEAKQSGPFVAATHLKSKDQMMVLRAKGLMHTYDLSTALWSDDGGLVEQSGIVSAYSGLSPLCSTQMAQALAFCDRPEGLVAYSQDGGVVVQSGGDWETLISDSAFVGLSGRLVDHDDITHIAVSGDKRWMLLTTQADGLGLFDLQRRGWVPIPRTVQSGLAGGDGLTPPFKLVAVGPEFLLATENGIVVLSFDETGAVKRAERLAEPDGKILDIASSDDETLVLGQKRCAGGDCLGLYRYNKEGGLDALLAETMLYPELSSTSVSRALVSEDQKQFFTLGRSGIHRYDRATRNWSRIWDHPTTVYLEAPSIDGIYFASAGKVGLLLPSGALRAWELKKQTVVSLALDKSGVLIAQTAENQTHRIAGAKPLMLVEGAVAREPLKSMRRAVAAFGKVVMIGQSYLVVHDPKKRSYLSVAKASLSTGSLFSDTTRLLGDANVLWAVSRSGVEAYRLTGEGAGATVQLVSQIQTSGLKRSLHTHNNHLYVVDAAGKPFRYALDGQSIRVQPLFGRSSPDRGTVVDALEEGDLTYLARDNKVSIYSKAARGYVEPVAMPINEAIREITKVDGQLYLLGSQGGVVAAGGTRRLSGSDTPVGIGSSDITDAFNDRYDLYMASRRGVSVYSFGDRRVVKTYRFVADHPVHIAGVEQSIPVTYDGQNAWFGDSSLSYRGAQVISASKVGRSITTVQKDHKATFLVQYALSNGAIGGPVCHYRYPGPQRGEIIDAAALNAGRVVALVGGTLWLRDHVHRRFVGFQVSQSSLPSDTKLTILSNHVVAHTDKSAWVIPKGALALPDSCSRAEIDVSSSVKRLDAKQLAVSTSTDSIWQLRGNGAVVQWQNGESKAILPSQGNSTPQPEFFQSVAQEGGGLYFGGSSGLWRYDLAERIWYQAPLSPFASDPTLMDIWATGNAGLVTVEREDAVSLGGTLASAPKVTELGPLAQADFPALPFDPEALIDVARLPNGDWLFLGKNAYSIADNPMIEGTRFGSVVDLGTGRSDRSVWRQNGEMILLEGDANAPEAMMIMPSSLRAKSKPLVRVVPNPDEQIVVLSGGRVLRLASDGSVRLCEQDEQAEPDGDGLVCGALLPAALQISREEVADAFAINAKRWLLHRADGSLSLVDRPLRKQIKLAESFGDIEAVFRGAKNIYLLDEDKKLFSLGPAGTQFELVASGVTAFETRIDKDLVQTEDGVQIVYGGSKEFELEMPEQLEDGIVAVERFDDGTQDFISAIEPDTNHLDPTRLDAINGTVSVVVGMFEVTRMEGSLRRTPASAASSTSMRWDRTVKHFVFSNHDGGDVSVSAREAMPEGRFAFSWPGRAVMVEAGRYMIANRFGTWVYRLGSINSFSWVPMDLAQQSISVGRGRIYFPDGRSVGINDSQPTEANPRYRVVSGRLQIDGNALNHRLTADWFDGVQHHQAFSQKGFLFDTRQDIAVNNSDEWMLTPLGLVAVSNMDRSAPIPVGRTTGITTVERRLYAKGADRSWAILNGTAWQQGENPFADKSIATEHNLNWAFVAGKLVTKATNGNRLLEQRQGLRFQQDVLNDAVHTPQGWVISMRDGARQIESLSGLVRDLPAASATIPTDKNLVYRRRADGPWDILAIANDGSVTDQWNGQALNPIARDHNPDVSRRAATSDWLRVRFDNRIPVAELLYSSVDGKKRWSPIGWSAGQPMPFDQFTSIHGHDAKLYAGSSVGLQILTVGKGRIGAQTFIDPRTRGVGKRRILKIGVPRSGGSALLAVGEGACLELQNGQLQHCMASNGLENEDLGGGAFWRWMRRGNQIRYYYLDSAQKPLGSTKSVPESGRFAHDIVDEVAICGGVYAQSWAGNFTQLASGFRLNNAKSYSLNVDGDLAFECQRKGAVPSPSEPHGLPAGLYVTDRNDQVWDGQSVVLVPSLRAALNNRQANGIPFESAKLRVRNRNGQVMFEYRRDGAWETLSLADGRLAMDRIDALVRSDDKVWGYTPEGFVSLDSQQGGVAPDTVSIVKVETGGTNVCAYDALATSDGVSSYLTVGEEKGATILRCADGRLFQGKLGSKQISTFEPWAKGTVDPFVTRQVYSDGVVTIQMIGRGSGRSGSLRFDWQGEENPLVAGRFALDDIKRVARLESSEVDMITGLGWIKQKRSSLDGAGASRPVNQADFARGVQSFERDSVLKVEADGTEAPVYSLCLVDKGGARYRWHLDGRLADDEACSGLDAFDGLYSYRKAKDGYDIAAPSLDGASLQRRLLAGRFDDLTLVGRAVLTQHAGRPVIALGSKNQIGLFALDGFEYLGGYSWARGLETLLLGSAGELAVFSGGKVRRIDGAAPTQCEGLEKASKVLGELATKASLLGYDQIGSESYGRFQVDEDSMEIAFSCKDDSGFQLGDVAQLGPRLRYRSNVEAWNRPASTLKLGVYPDLTLEAKVGQRLLSLDPLSEQALFSRWLGDQFVIVHPSEIYGVDVDAMLSKVMEEGVQ